ncbi:MAG: hypothetical protein C0467_27505 [Planctomycetaceae bacterium]|nr:hypothetical protein [Planctomycetaceae bacterium]
MTSDYFKNNVVPIAFGLAIGVFFIWLEVSTNRAKEKEFQQRLNENANWIDSQKKQNNLWAEPPDQKRERKDAEAVMDAFLDDILIDNFAAAYGRTTPTFQTKMTQDALAELVRANPVIREPEKCVVFGNATLSKAVQTTTQLRKVPGDGKTTTVVNIRAELHNARWLVSEFKVEPRATP